MNDKEKFIILLSNHYLKEADAICVLEGDGYNRLSHAAKLHKDGWASKIIICPGVDNPSIGASADLMSKLLDMGVSESSIENIGKAKNTYEEANVVLDYARKNKWKRIIMVTSNFHQYRAFLTFLKVLKDKKMEIDVINSPARELSWFTNNLWGTRFELLEKEFSKIEEYGKQGHVANFKEYLDYHREQEK